MPKKLSLPISKKTDYSNNKKLRLRSKGVEFRKAISNPDWAQKLKLRLKKEGKLSLLSDFRGFLTNVNGKLPTKKAVEKLTGRPLKCLNMNSSWNKKFNNNNNANRKAMSVEFDHMYLNCGDSKLNIGREIELQHLKELNVLHLDIIQQQSDELAAKDKLISTLKEENKNLQARLERIERRVSLSLQKKQNEILPITVETDLTNDPSFPCCIKSEGSPRSLGHKSPPGKILHKSSIEKSPFHRDDLLAKSDDLFSKKEGYAKKTSPNRQLVTVSPISSSSPRDRRLRSDSSIPSDYVTNVPDIATDAIRKPQSPVNRRFSDDQIWNEKRLKSEDLLEKEKNELFWGEEEGLTDHSLRSRAPRSPSSAEEALLRSQMENFVPSSLSNFSFSNQSPSASDISRCKAQFKDEMPKVRSEGILVTNETYYLPCHTTLSFCEVLDEDGVQMQVEIPKWRIKPFTTLYVMEGTENLEDEIFVKRHAKPEHDERRRKRWDLQRMREQRQYEKLRERYEGRNNISNGMSKNQPTLWPRLEGTQTIVIDNSIPVCAFGQPLAQIPESDFYVPWLSGKVVAPARKHKR